MKQYGYSDYSQMEDTMIPVLYAKEEKAKMGTRKQVWPNVWSKQKIPPSARPYSALLSGIFLERIRGLEPLAFCLGSRRSTG